MKTLILSTLVTFTALQAPSLFAGQCAVKGSASIPGVADCPNCATAENAPIFGSWTHTSTESYPGALYASQGGVAEGANLVYRGAADPAAHTYVMFGNYLNYHGISNFAMSSRITFSTNWRPTGREICTKHKTRVTQDRVCVQRAMQWDPTSFVVDIVQDGGTNVIYQKAFQNVNAFNNTELTLPNIECTGDMTNLEIRIRDISGGSVDFTIHNVYVDARWNDA